MAEANIWGTTVPSTFAGSDSPVELGCVFIVTASGGSAVGVRFYKHASNTGTHVGYLYAQGGSQLASVTFTGESSSGWQRMDFSSPVSLSTGQDYVISYHTTTGYYAAEADSFLGANQVYGDITVYASDSRTNMVYRYGSAGTEPTSMWETTNYYVDLVFDDGVSAGSEPPRLRSKQIQHLLRR